MSQLRIKHVIRRFLIPAAVLLAFLALAAWIFSVEDVPRKCGFAASVPDAYLFVFRSLDVQILVGGQLPFLWAVMIGWMCVVLYQEKRRPLFLLLFLGIYFAMFGEAILYYGHPTRLMIAMCSLSALSFVEVFFRRLRRRSLWMAIVSSVCCLGCFITILAIEATWRWSP